MVELGERWGRVTDQERCAAEVLWGLHGSICQKLGPFLKAEASGKAVGMCSDQARGRGTLREECIGNESALGRFRAGSQVLRVH